MSGKASDLEVREALDRIYAEESSELDGGLARMQWMSLMEEDWLQVEKDDADGQVEEIAQ